jgi:predicted Zn-dependent protease
MAQKNWSALQTNLAQQNWSDLDCLRRACRARAFKEQNLTSSAKAEWIEAMRATGNQLPLLVQLLNTTTRWNWQAEPEDVLWAIANRYPSEVWAIQALAERLYKAGNTRGLQTLFAQALQADKENLQSKNNLAITALLLESWEKKPHDLAREVYAKSPTNASFASTYAYSLLVQRQPIEALKVMDQLPPADLQKPSIAAYYGLVLKATGNAGKAKECFELAAKAKLLPEEQKLIAKAKNTN